LRGFFAGEALACAGFAFLVIAMLSGGEIRCNLVKNRLGSIFSCPFEGFQYLGTPALGNSRFKG
jgi:hypothetical protein